MGAKRCQKKAQATSSQHPAMSSAAKRAEPIAPKAPVCDRRRAAQMTKPKATAINAMGQAVRLSDSNKRQ